MASTISVNDRRQAALARLGKESATPQRVRRSRGPSKPPRVRSQRAPRETLGAPAGVWYGIIAVVIVFVMLGLVMVLSASAVTEANRGNSPYSVFLRQATWAGLGLVGMVIVAKIPYGFWRRMTVPLVVVGIAAMLGPFAPMIGGSVNGARAWIRVGGFSVQPSEFLKLVVVIVTADLLTPTGGRDEPSTSHPPAAGGHRRRRSGTVHVAGRPRVGDRARCRGVLHRLDRRRPVHAACSDGLARHGCRPVLHRLQSDPDRPLHGVSRRHRQQGSTRLADLPGVRQHGVGRHRRVRHRWQQDQARLPAVRPQRLHLRDHRGRVGSDRCGSGDRWFHPAGAVRCSDRARFDRPIRDAGRRRRGLVVRSAGDRQPRRRDGTDAGDRAHAAVLLGRRQFVVRLDDRRRSAAERRADVSEAEGSSSPRRVAS